MVGVRRANVGHHILGGIVVSLVVGAKILFGGVIDEDLGPRPTAQVRLEMLSPDCSHVATVAKLQDKSELYIDGKAAASADEIVFVLFAPDSKGMAYVARIGGLPCVVRDGTVGQTFDEIPPESLRFSGNGQHLYYAGRRRDGWFGVLDGKEYPANSKQPEQVLFSGDGRHLVFVISDMDGKRIVVDGVQGDPWRDISSLTVSRDGFHIAYVAEGEGSRRMVVLDGKETSPEFASVDHICFSPDGKDLAYIGHMTAVASEEARQEVVANGIPGPPYYEILAGPTYSPDSHHIAYSARYVQGFDGNGIFNRPHFKKDRELLTVDETPANCGWVVKLLYSAGDVLVSEEHLSTGNNSDFAGSFRRKIYLDSRQIEIGVTNYYDDSCRNLTFSPDGRQWACSARGSVGDGTSNIWLNGRQLNNPGVRLGPPLFSPDGEHLAYAAQFGGVWRIVLDSEAEPANGLVIPTSDLDGRDGQWFGLTAFLDQDSVENGHAYSGAYPYHFGPDGTLVYFRISNGHLYRVHWKPDGLGIAAPATRP